MVISKTHNSSKTCVYNCRQNNINNLARAPDLPQLSKRSVLFSTPYNHCSTVWLVELQCPTPTPPTPVPAVNHACWRALSL